MQWNWFNARLLKRTEVYITLFNKEHESKFYIGMTPQTFKEKIKDHIYNIKFHKPSRVLKDSI